MGRIGVMAVAMVLLALTGACLLYTSDAADDLLCVDLGGRRIIKKKKKSKNGVTNITIADMHDTRRSAVYYTRA